MRAFGSGSLLLTACVASSLAFGVTSAAAQTEPAPSPPTQPSPPAPAPPTPPPTPAPPTTPTPAPPAPAPPTPAAPLPAPSATDSAAPAPAPTSESAPPPAGLPQTAAPLDEQRPATTLAASAHEAPPAPLAARFGFDYDLLPLTLEARFGFNARFGSSFDPSDNDQVLDTSFAFGAYLAWSPEYAVGLELEQAGLGRIRGLSGENSIDAEYSATSAWLATRVFPWHSERLDVFVNLRLGLAMQHVNALGTRQESDSIAVPAQSFSCTAWDGPGIGLGAALGLNYRLARHVAFVSRLDATGERLSGDELGTCADGIGSVTSVAGSVGLAYTFETAKK